MSKLSVSIKMMEMVPGRTYGFVLDFEVYGTIQVIATLRDGCTPTELIAMVRQGDKEVPCLLQVGNNESSFGAGPRGNNHELLPLLATALEGHIAKEFEASPELMQYVKKKAKQV